MILLPVHSWAVVNGDGTVLQLADNRQVAVSRAGEYHRASGEPVRAEKVTLYQLTDEEVELANQAREGHL